MIRPAKASDACAIVAIWNHAISHTAVTFTTAQKSKTAIAADIKARGAAFQVAEENGELIGFATYFAFRNGPGYARTKEHSILLAPRAQGRGAGRALMGALEEAARGEGVHSLWAGVSGENPEGVRFHAALGFAEVARLPEVGFKFDRWIDLVLMQKFL